jgi:membrane protein DedA with SNARE-associated domain
MHGILLHIIQYSYLGIFFALGLGILGLPIPDELLMSMVGFLIFQGKMNFFFAVVFAFIGTSSGITVGYLLGRILGDRFVKKYSTKLHLDYDHIQNARNLYNRYGKFVLVAGYFVPGVRHLTAIMAGASLMPYGVFALFAYAGAFFWTVTFISIGYFLGGNWRHIYLYSYNYILPLVLIISLILILVFYFRAAQEEKK